MSAKTKAQLLADIKALQKRFTELQAVIAEPHQKNDIYKKQAHALGERVKELNCLYGISHLVDTPGISLPKILQGSVNLLPPAWQYPNITCARITLDDQEYKTENFRETNWKLASEIEVEDKSIGSVEVFYLKKHPKDYEGPFLKDKRALIDAVVKCLGRIIQHMQAEEERNLLLKLTQGIIKTPNFNSAIEYVLRSVCEATNWAYGEVWIPGEDGAALECFPVWYSSSPDKMKKFRQVGEETRFQANTGLPGRVWSSKLHEWVPDTSTTSDKIFLRARVAAETGFKAAVGIPIIAGEDFLGVLVFLDFKTYQEDNHQVELVSAVAAQLGEVIHRKQAQDDLQETLIKLQKTMNGTIQALALTVEARDPYTAGHQRRVADLAAAIATEMGLSDEQVEGIKMAGVVHDLGKIQVPAEILSKPRKLTELEFGLIKTHPQVGFDLLKTIEFPWPIAEMVLQHHEKMDGSGYPQGLKGNKILLEARILAVADVVEAMSSHRPYRPAHGIEKALKQIKKDKGTLLDSKVVDACLKIFKGGYELPES